ncbi:MAG TPA: S-adenosylmethionine:tRNA ribosyltransferase-isomerase, partial [Labilithrix sp.]|nr:S-adenosylmethionine:tRNA ribosyltransferase-isomerase [Labilithrix sp.]
MNAAPAPRAAAEVRLLVVDGPSGTLAARDARDLPELLAPGDLVVVNDAATLPATLLAHDARGAFVELRLVSAVDPGAGTVQFRAALLGEGDHRVRTEDRPPPPRVAPGDVLRIGEDLEARIVSVAPFSERLVDLALVTTGSDDPAAVWAALYRLGKPVQYAHVPRPLALWDVQNAWAGRPWAVEMPSAGRAIRTATLLALRRRGVDIAWVTHAAGLSATGDPAIDARLPFPERFDVPEATARAIRRTKARGGRVVAVGTSVARALESAARRSGAGRLRGASGTTDLLLGPETALAVVDGLLTGVHERSTTHFLLLGAFAERALLESALVAAEEAGFL